MASFVRRAWKDRDAPRVPKGFLKLLRTQSPFALLRDWRISWTSNGGEREIRGFAIYRAPSGGSGHLMGNAGAGPVHDGVEDLPEARRLLLGSAAEEGALVQSRPGPPSKAS